MAITDVVNPWRQLLLTMASFRGIVFHVETGSRTGGRRIVVHEYPKRNDNYSEDMGRHAPRINFNGYLIYNPSNPNYRYVEQRIALREALDDNDAGWLVHPVFAPGGMMAMCERYTMTETRERGGYTVFDMAFVWVGTPVKGMTDTNGNVVRSTNDAESAAKVSMDQTIGRGNPMA